MKIFIIGMSCEHCVKAVTKALEALNLQNIHVNLKEGFATFDGAYDEKIIKEAIEDIGYDVEKIEK